MSLAFSTCASLEIYRCPVDTPVDARGASSYAVNDGLLPVVGWQNAFVPDREPFLKWSHVSDGLSQTALCSELRSIRQVPIGSPIDPRDGQWAIPFAVTKPYTITEAEINLFAQQCEETSRKAPPQFARPSVAYYAPNSGYNHVGTPNSPSCVSIDVLRNLASSLPAASNHGAGVNVLMADGAVRHASSLVDLVVWRAVGSRNGNEFESNSF